VTEFITGQDLVEWQLLVAAGERLPLTQDQLRITGHAIEARVYSEDPARDFLPSIGRLDHLRQPERGPHIRVDTGVRQGDAITPYYDPMIAKLIVWGEDRTAALRRLSGALAAYEVVGVHTNLGLLRGIAAHPDFARAELDTGFIGRHPEVLAGDGDGGGGVGVGMTADAAGPDGVAGTPALDDVVLAAAALTALTGLQAEQQAGERADPWSPWGAADAWRLNGDGYADLSLLSGDTPIHLRAHPRPDGGFMLDMPRAAVHADAREDADGLRLRLDGVLHRLRVVRRGPDIVVIRAGRNHVLRHLDPLAPPRTETGGDDRVIAPIPGRITRILVQPGDRVQRGAPLLVLEAMKMELTLSAPLDGRVEAIRHAVGDMVEEGTELVVFAAAGDDAAGGSSGDAAAGGS
jgi:3-methylcrotonyl-CoA carboxylase alpha subunit